MVGEGAESEILVGIDVGTSKVATVVGAVGEHGLRVLGAGFAPVEGVRKGEVVNIETTSQAILQAVEEAEKTSHIQIRRVVVSVGGNHIRAVNTHGVNPIRTPEIAKADVARVLDGARAIPLPADREVLHVLPQEFVLDGQAGIMNPVGMSGERLEARVHVISTGIRQARNVHKCCERLGFVVQDMILAPFAASEAAVSREEKDLGVVLIDLGAGTSSVLVFGGGALRHTEIVAVGSNYITSDIAAYFKTPFRDAEILKQRWGNAMASRVAREQSVEVAGVGGRDPRLVSRQELARIIEARVEEILTLCRNQLSRSGVTDAPASGVVLTGGGALLDGMAALAEQVFRSPVRVGGALGIDTDPDGPAAGLDSPVFSTAIGLLLYGANPRDYRPAPPEDPGPIDRIRGAFGRWTQTILPKKLKKKGE